jgi:hypothetical protein
MLSPSIRKLALAVVSRCFAAPHRRYFELHAHNYAVGIDHGYINHILYALVPVIWFPYMEKKLDYWEKNLASPAEKELVGHTRDSLTVS